MKIFDERKFCNDLVALRGRETQKDFAEKLNVNRSTLSLLETGKQMPSLEILTKVCNLGDFKVDDYFIDRNNDALIYLMGTVDEKDKEKISLMINRIKVKEKYDMLARRCADGFNR